VLLQDGQPMLADFGIALAVAQAGGTRITETGLSLGTPHSMSPEQATGEVDVVLQGSVRRAGERMRVSVQLTDAKQGVEMWSQTYDRDTKDAFAVQGSITHATVRQLSLSLGSGALAATRTGRTAPRGTRLYRRSLAKDPSYTCSRWTWCLAVSCRTNRSPSIHRRS